MMKRLLALVLLVLTCTGLFSQQITLTFTGRDTTTQSHVALSRIEITDITRGWTETLTYPDTTAILTAVSHIEENGNNAKFALSQNAPNPFNSTTIVNLTVTESGPVTMKITDVNGHIVETFPETSLQYGTHQFRINIAAPGFYFLTAHQNGKTSSIKMMNNGNGEKNGIEYIIVETFHETSLQPKTSSLQPETSSLQPETSSLQPGTSSPKSRSAIRGDITFPFQFGDQMEYAGFTIVNGTEMESQHIIQQQVTSQTFTFLFDFPQESQDGQPCPGTPTLTDADGNTYNTVQIGAQCWMRENLKTTKYADFASIENGSTTSDSIGFWYYPNDDSTHQETYGLLYNWKAVMRDAASSNSNPSAVPGICPTGWHVPSDAEWTQLTNYVSSQNAYCCNSNTNYIAKSLAATTGWDSYSGTCCIGDTPDDNNATGFGALAAGLYSGSYYYFGTGAGFWSATENAETNAWARPLLYNGPSVGHGYANKAFAYSVRCIRD